VSEAVAQNRLRAFLKEGLRWMLFKAIGGAGGT